MAAHYTAVQTAADRPAPETYSRGFAIPPAREHDRKVQEHNGDDRFSQSDHRSNDGSQASNATTLSDQVFTPTHSQTAVPNGSSQESLLQLSAIAAAQERMATDIGDVITGGRKRMADGEVKDRGSTSPMKGHSRNPSTISMASTTASTVCDISDLKTRLAYAMVKVNNGWQNRSLEEVEGLASHAASPVSTISTAFRRAQDSSSPQAQVRFADEPPSQRRKSNSPPNPMTNRPTLAPPASIRPGNNPRRNSNPHYTPALLGQHSHSSSPRTPGITNGLLQHRALSDLYSPHQNGREKDVAEALLFMSSPGNSANMKHGFSPAGSPGPNSQTPRSAASMGRDALSGNRKALPGGRPQAAPKRVDFHNSIHYSPQSPMDIDSPRVTRRRTINGVPPYPRAPTIVSEKGLGVGSRMRELSDRDIDKMLDDAVAAVSSRGDPEGYDDEMIEIPARVAI